MIRKKKYMFRKKPTRKEIMRFRRMRTYTVLFILFLFFTKWVVDKIGEGRDISKSNSVEQAISTQKDEPDKEKVSENKDKLNSIEKLNIPVVNKDNWLDKSYVPKDLVKIDVKMRGNITTEETLLQKDAAKDLKEMFNSAKADGIILYASSGYRSYTTQKRLYQDNINRNGKSYTDSYVAEAGTSEHQLGLAMDICTSNLELEESFENTQEGIWIKNNAYKYGYIIRYPKGKEIITGYSYEPWHVRYVGKEVAKEINDKKITLEEYIEIE